MPVAPVCAGGPGLCRRPRSVPAAPTGTDRHGYNTDRHLWSQIQSGLKQTHIVNKIVCPSGIDYKFIYSTGLTLIFRYMDKMDRAAMRPCPNYTTRGMTYNENIQGHPLHSPV